MPATNFDQSARDALLGIRPENYLGGIARFYDLAAGNLQAVAGGIRTDADAAIGSICHK